MKLSLVQRVRSELRRSKLRDLVLSYRFRGVTEQDVIFVSYPKSGSTWLTFMLAELIWGEGQDQKITDFRYIPTVPTKHLCERRLPSGGRIMRTHERYRPCCRKVIYMVRDGRDVVASMYYHILRVTGMEADFSTFLDFYLDRRAVGAGLWHEHVLNWIDSPPFRTGGGLLVRYEDMKRDARHELERCAEFLDLECTPEQLDKAVAAGSLDSMRKSEKQTERVTHREKGPEISFVRKGVVGDWANHFSDADLERYYAVSREAMERLGYEMEDAVSQR
jgi:estrone sulfotransferase